MGAQRARRCNIRSGRSVAACWRCASDSGVGYQHRSISRAFSLLEKLSESRYTEPESRVYLFSRLYSISKREERKAHECSGCGATGTKGEFAAGSLFVL